MFLCFYALCFIMCSLCLFYPASQLPYINKLSWVELVISRLHSSDPNIFYNITPRYRFKWFIAVKFYVPNISVIFVLLERLWNSCQLAYRWVSFSPAWATDLLRPSQCQSPLVKPQLVSYCWVLGLLIYLSNKRIVWCLSYVFWLYMITKSPYCVRCTNTMLPG